MTTHNTLLATKGMLIQLACLMYLQVVNLVYFTCLQMRTSVVSCTHCTDLPIRILQLRGHVQQGVASSTTRETHSRMAQQEQQQENKADLKDPSNSCIGVSQDRPNRCTFGSAHNCKIFGVGRHC